MHFPYAFWTFSRMGTGCVSAVVHATATSLPHIPATHLPQKKREGEAILHLHTPANCRGNDVGGEGEGYLERERRRGERGERKDYHLRLPLRESLPAMHASCLSPLQSTWVALSCCLSALELTSSLLQKRENACSLLGKGREGAWALHAA